MLACQIRRLWSNIWDVKYQTGFVPSKITRNILMACPFVYSSISSFLTPSQEFFSGCQLRRLRCRLHRFGFCLQFWHERLPVLGFLPPTHPFEWQLKDRNCPLPLLAECRWSKVNLWENTSAWNANRTIAGLAGAVGEESCESSKFLLESFLS